MGDVWYYAAANKSVGPISLEGLVRFLSATMGARDVLVWRDGFEGWQKASSVPELAVHVVKPPPLPTPPPPLPVRTNSATSAPSIAIDERRFGEPAPLKGQSVGEGDLVGIGGWLVLVALGRIYGPLALLVWIANYYSSLDSSIWTTYPFVAYTEAVLNLGVFALSLWTTILFFRKSKSFPGFFIYSAVALVVLLPLDLLLVTTMGPSIETLISAVTPQEGGQWGQSVISALIWIPYMKMSKRVANTFIY